jgi:hypothetical protein
MYKSLAIFPIQQPLYVNVLAKLPKSSRVVAIISRAPGPDSQPRILRCAERQRTEKGDCEGSGIAS